jgi:transcriptional regulator
MHPNPSFRGDAVERHIAFARQRAFGVLAVGGPDGPLLSHVPFLLSEDGALLEMHLVRSNPIARLTEVEAVIAVNGPDSYISPDWYGVADQVPTWNYVAVHIRGRLVRRDAGEMRDLLARQSAAFERRLAPKPEWTLDKMSDVAIDRLLRMIVPFELQVSQIDGTWKLNQNKPDAARLGAAGQVEASHLGHETDELAALMRGVPRKA